jgi:hypothetical protein
MTNTQISTATNITGPDISYTPNLPQKYFNNFFSRDFSSGPDVDDAVTAYFEQYTGSKASGKLLASTVMYTAQSQGMDPMIVLAEFKKLSKGSLDNYLAAFLNFNRVSTSTIGIKQTNGVSPFIARAILL